MQEKERVPASQLVAEAGEKWNDLTLLQVLDQLESPDVLSRLHDKEAVYLRNYEGHRDAIDCKSENETENGVHADDSSTLSPQISIGKHVKATHPVKEPPPVIVQLKKKEKTEKETDIFDLLYEVNTQAH